MNRGTSLIESMISLFLSGILILSSNYFIKNMSKTGKISEKIAENIGEQSLSITYLANIIRAAGQGIEAELSIEVNDNLIVLRKKVKDLILKENANKGDNYIIVKNKGLKKGGKIAIGKTLYTIVGVNEEKLFLDKSLDNNFSYRNSEIKFVKEYYLSYIKNKGVCLKINRGYYQLITDKFKNLKFDMFNEFTLKIEGEELQTDKWKPFELYMVIPSLAINGGAYERF